MNKMRSLPLCVSASVFLCSLTALAQQAAPLVRIVHPIDESHLVTLSNTVHPLANGANDRGAAPDGMRLDRMQLVLRRSSAQEAALRQLIVQMHTPGSPSYHQWLTPEQFGAQFGASDQDIATVSSWLGSHGFSVSKVNPGKGTLEFSGSVAQLREGFHTQIHTYSVHGETHYANATDPQIPAALAPVIAGFSSLNNFRIKSQLVPAGRTTFDPTTGKAKSLWTTGSGTFDYQTYNFVMSPGDFAVQYDLNPLYTQGIKGDGQTIAIVNDSNINIALVNQFRTLFGLSANPPQVIVAGNDPGVDGANNPDGPNFDSSEAYLDTEWAGAVAPNATIDLVVGGDTALESGLILAAEQAVYGNVAPVVSVSFGACEINLGITNQFIDDLWEQAAAQGQTVLVSTGDNGSAQCDGGTDWVFNGQAVNGLASTPFNVAVGGTDFFYSSYSGAGTTQGDQAIDTQLGTYWNTTASNNTPAVSLKGYVPEQPWNDSQFGLDLFSEYVFSGGADTITTGGGGGASNAAVCSAYNASGFCSGAASGYPKPSWQPSLGTSDTTRDLPDVSLFSANGYNDTFYGICATDGDCQPVGSGSSVQIYGVGGTSASAPAFAGIMALVNQKYGRQGQADTILYPLATQFPAAFHDVVVGNNSVPCEFQSTTSTVPSPDCIQIAANTNDYVIITSSTGSQVLEGQIGTGTTVEYNATTGYDLASGLGSVDAAVLVADWGNVKLNATTTSLTAPNPSTIAHGQAMTIAGTVTASSGTPTGNVALMTDSPEPGQQGAGLATLLSGSPSTFALNGSGAYSGSVRTLPGGTYNIWSSYGGDASNAGSLSQKTPITVSPESTGIAFDLIAPGPSYFSSNITANVDYGTQLLLSAQVAPTADVAGLQSCLTTTAACPAFAPPTGTVAFSDNSTNINTAVINSEGDAEYNAPFAVGSHSVTAKYSGDNSYNASTASAITFTVAKDTPVVLVSASNQTGATTYAGQTNQPTVVNVLIENGAIASFSSSSAIYPVSVAPPTGTIIVTGLPSGTASAVLTPGVDPATGAPDGIATFTIPASSSSQNFTVTINYPGDANYNAAAGNASIQVQAESSGKSSTTAAALSGNTLSPTAAITVTGMVTGQGTTAPTGSIYVFSSGYSITQVFFSSSSGDVSNFSFTLNSQTLFQGGNFITLQYSGDSTYYSSAVTLNGGSAITNPLADFTMIAQAPIVPVSSTASGGDTLNLASVNGFSGNVTLACAAPTGITCTLPNPATVALTSGSSGSAAVQIAAASSVADGNYNLLITAKDATGNYVHTTAIEAAVNSSSAGFALSNGGNVTVSQGAATGNTSTITATPSSNFQGVVYLSCLVTATPAGATNPATCTIPASVNITSGAAGQAVSVITNSATTTGSYTIKVTGVSGSITQTTSITATVNAAASPSFALSAGTAASVNPGSSTSSTITVAGSNGYTGSVSFSCTLKTSPAGAVDIPTCTPGSTVTLPCSGATCQSTASVSTTAVSADLIVPKIHDGKGWLGAGSGALLALLVFFGIPARRRSWRALLGIFVMLAALGVMTSCGGSSGGGGGGGGGGNPGTTAGSYTFTVTGTGNPAVTPAPTTTFTFTVN